MKYYSKELNLFSYDDEDLYRYREVEDGIEVVGYAGSKFHIAIPDTIHGKTVVAIGVDKSFVRQDRELYVKIPNTVHTISPETNPRMSTAWYQGLGMDDLQPYWTFVGGCLYTKDLKTLHIIYSCEEDFIVPDSVEHISAYVFKNMQLKSLQLSPHLKSIGDEAFSSNSITNYSIVIPKTVSDIGNRICNKYEIDSENPYFIVKDNCVYTASGNVLIQCFDNMIDQLTIPDEVEEIRPYAFEKCRRLTKLDLGTGVKRIGDYAFVNAKVKTLRLPASLEYISPVAFSFERCNSIRVEKESCHYETDGTCLFQLHEDGTKTLVVCYKNKIEEYTVPEGVIAICYGAFFDCSELREITLPESLKHYNEGSIPYRICEVTIPAGVETIEIPYNYNRVSVRYHINEKNLSYFVEGDVLYHRTKDGLEALKGMGNKGELVLKEGTTRICSHAFYHCRKITSVVMPTTLKSIERFAFYGLEKVTFNEGLEKIEYRAFDKCVMTSVILPNTLCVIEEQAIDSEMLISYCVSENHPWYTVENGILYNKEKTKLVHVPERVDLKKVQLPETVVEIGEAFKGCKTVKEIILSPAIKELALNALYCEAKNIYVGEEVVFIGKNVFNYWNDTKLKIYGKKDSFVEQYVREIMESVRGANILFVQEGAEDITNLSTEFDLLLNDTGLTIVKLLEEKECVVVPEKIGDYTVTKIGAGAFITNEYSGGMMRELILPDTVIEIGKEMCSGRKKLQKVRLPKHIKKIPKRAFCYCSALMALEIPSEVEEIEANTLFGCDNLSLLGVPKSVTMIDKNIFTDEEGSYKDLYLCDRTICIVDKDSYAEKFFSAYTPEYKKTLDVLSLHDDIAFEFDTKPVAGVTSSINKDYTVTVELLETWKCNEEVIVIPETMYGLPVTIVKGFSRPGNELKRVEIPKTVTTIEGFGRYTPYSKLKEVIVDEDNAVYWSDGKALYTKDKKTLIHMCCMEIEEYTIHEDTKIIYEFAFSGCKLLKKVILPKGLEEIQKGAFVTCYDVQEIVGFDDVKVVDDTAISETAFYKKLDVVIAGTVLQMYNGTGKKKYVIKDGITEISAYAFTTRDAKDVLEEIVIPKTVKKIGGHAFEGRIQLKKIALPEGIEEISEAMFSGCSNLEQIVIPESVKTIQQNAFAKCSALKQLVIPKNVTQISPMAVPIEIQSTSRYSPSYSSVFKEYVVDEENEMYCAKDGILYAKDMTILHSIPSDIAIATLLVPDTVTTIGSQACTCNKKIQRIRLAESVKRIEKRAFEGCLSLEEINLESVTNIEIGAFRNCKKLKKASLSCIETIEDSIFSGCSALSELELPKAKTIGEYAFHECKALTQIDLLEGVETIGASAFAKCGFKKVTVPKSVKLTGNESFSGCEEITIFDTIDPNAKPCDAKIDSVNGHPNSVVGFIGIGPAWAMWQCAANHRWVDHEIIVRSAETDEIKYKVPMKADPSQRQYYCILTSAWGKNGTFAFTEVDDFFSSIKGIDIKQEVAINRLRYPVDLTEEMKKSYEAYLVRSAKDLMRECITNNDMETLLFCEPIGIIKKNNIDEMIEFANKQNAVSFAAYFMEYKNVHFATTKKVGSGFALSEKAPKTQKNKEWSMTKNAPGKIARYKGVDTELVFPTEVNGEKVTGVANTTTKVPDNYRNIVSVVLPEGYRTIGDCAFYGCENLEKVVLPSTLETIGRSAFENCKKLKEVVISENVTTIGRSAFENCSVLGNVIFGNSVAHIEERAFLGCSSITKVDLPKSLKSVAKDCFTSSSIHTVIIRSDFVLSSGQCFNWPRYIYANKEAVSGIYGLHPTKVRPLSDLIEKTEFADPSEQRLAGKTFVVTGTIWTFPDRDGLKTFIEQHGGRMTGSVSKKTSYLLTNETDSTTTKAQKAKELGIPTMTEQEFLNLVKK